MVKNSTNTRRNSKPRAASASKGSKSRSCKQRKGVPSLSPSLGLEDRAPKLIIKLPRKYPTLDYKRPEESRRQSIETLEAPQASQAIAPSSRATSDRFDDFGDIFDPFNCNTDKESFSTVLSSVKQLNYHVDDAISNILLSFSSGVKRFASLEFRSARVQSSFPATLYNELLLDHESKGHYDILDAFLHDQVNNFLFHTYFEGTNFYGLEPNVESMLERMFTRVQEREPWPVAQRWRAITISSVFSDGSDVAPYTDTLLQILWEAFRMAYPTNNRNFRKMATNVLNGEKQNLHRFISMARDISHKIQCSILSARMRVTLAPRPDSLQLAYCGFDPLQTMPVWPDTVPEHGDEVLCTFSLGLEYETEAERKAVLLPGVITSSLLQKFGTSSCSQVL